MRTIRLGRTGLEVSGVSFGALPIQRITREEAVPILRRAVAAGVNFFDTARSYADSEEKIGLALSDVRETIIIATKSQGETGEAITAHIDQSLAALNTGYIDLFQTHNPKTVPLPGDGTERYEALLRARDEGKIRHIGLSNHRLELAVQAAESGLYDTIQYPFSILSTPREVDFAGLCKNLDVGFIAMKGLSGGLVRHIPASYAFIRRFANVVPIWGIQKLEELEEFLALEANPPVWDETMQALVEEERKELGKDFCRGCGYCLPCPEDISIPMLARMRLFLNRGPWRRETLPDAQTKYARAENCIDCGQCASRCPYELDPAALVRENYAYYKAFIAEKRASGAL